MWAASPDPTPFIAGGASVALLIALSGILIRLLVLTTRRDKADEKRARAQDRRIRVLELENRWCNRRVSLLIATVQRSGISVPPEVWSGPDYSELGPDELEEPGDDEHVVS